jgi:hypothetical protein
VVRSLPEVGGPAGFTNTLGGQDARVLSRPIISTFTLLWLAVGVAVAAAYDYFDQVGTGRLIASAVLAVVLWPLLFLGIDLYVKP